MKALLLDFEARRPIEDDIPEPPAPGPGQVLLAPAELGICATDRELARFRFGEPPPGESRLVLVHETLARVLAAGPGVDSVSPGDWVVPALRRPCRPPCPACAAGRADLCRTGRYTERGIFRAHGYAASRALDDASALTLVPDLLLDVAVLLEPLSVVEKAVARAFALCPLPPRTAAIAGLGPIGILTAFALLLRGLDVTLVSIEPEDHPRAGILRRAGGLYLRDSTPQCADLVFEASGADAASVSVLDWVAPSGALVYIGASGARLPLDNSRLIVENLALAGTVNAAPEHFAAALADLTRCPRAWLDGFLERRPFSAWPEFLAAPGSAPKSVLCF